MPAYASVIGFSVALLAVLLNTVGGVMTYVITHGTTVITCLQPHT